MSSKHRATLRKSRAAWLRLLVLLLLRLRWVRTS